MNCTCKWPGSVNKCAEGWHCGNCGWPVTESDPRPELFTKYGSNVFEIAIAQSRMFQNVEAEEAWEFVREFGLRLEQERCRYEEYLRGCVEQLTDMVSVRGFTLEEPRTFNVTFRPEDNSAEDLRAGRLVVNMTTYHYDSEGARVELEFQRRNDLEWQQVRHFLNTPWQHDIPAMAEEPPVLRRVDVTPELERMIDTWVAELNAQKSES